MWFFPRLAWLCFHGRYENLLATVLCVLSVSNSSPILSLRSRRKIFHNSCIQYLSLAFGICLAAESIVFLSRCPIFPSFSIILTVYEESLQQPLLKNISVQILWNEYVVAFLKQELCQLIFFLRFWDAHIYFKW